MESNGKTINKPSENYASQSGKEIFGANYLTAPSAKPLDILILIKVDRNSISLWTMTTSLWGQALREAC